MEQEVQRGRFKRRRTADEVLVEQGADVNHSDIPPIFQDHNAVPV